ncbi:histidinol-phosphate aminotransferase [Antricoccus suffuscus]|uniref:Histidinol-phosphate aminotransferase n=1 Tax=Antricoccus suffuscus TaxID=1629062 RepID=A0A2T0Z694_9ACTN|nr:histidinol-phosphate transaminase [Antricoccus suffuscus]PRZ31688.1 histidinol-phosphate aminotransferase [Antricoccus suffuscus]
MSAQSREVVRSLLRPEFRELTAYGAPQLDVPVRLNTNENSYELPDAVAQSVTAALAAEVKDLNRYPDREFTRLRGALSGYLATQAGVQLDVAQLWAANGSNEVIQHILQAFGGPGRRALGFVPSYSMHELISISTGTGWIRGRRDEQFDLQAADALAQIAEHDPDVVFLCSPNNPTGTSMSRDVVEAVLGATRGIVVVDEAYAEFAREGTPSALGLLPDNPRLIVSRTMSKAFAFAGARVGYLAADPEITEAMRLVRLPYHLSSLTQAAAIAALGHADLLLSTVDAIKGQRDRIVRTLADFGLLPVPSDSNFVMFGGLADAGATWQALLDHGILVRDIGIAHHLRVSAGTEAETTAFLDALRDHLRDNPPTARQPVNKEIA